MKVKDPVPATKKKGRLGGLFSCGNRIPMAEHAVPSMQPSFNTFTSNHLLLCLSAN